MQVSTLPFLLRRLRDLREAHGLTQEALAEKAGMSYKHYQAIEGGRKDLRLTTLDRLAAAFGIELWELIAPAMPTVAQPKEKRRRTGSKPRGTAK